MKVFYKGLPGKKGKLNMITSTVVNKYTDVRGFCSSSIIGLSSSSSGRSRNVEKPWSTYFLLRKF